MALDLESPSGIYLPSCCPMNSSDERCCGRRFTPCRTSDLDLSDYQEIKLQERRKSNDLATDSQAISVILRAGLVNSCDPGGRLP